MSDWCCNSTTFNNAAKFWLQFSKSYISKTSRGDKNYYTSFSDYLIFICIAYRNLYMYVIRKDLYESHCTVTILYKGFLHLSNESLFTIIIYEYNSICFRLFCFPTPFYAETRSFSKFKSGGTCVYKNEKKNDRLASGVASIACCYRK